jgi:hypothetical protein
MIRVRSANRIAHDGVVYEEGATFSLPAEAAAALVACGAAVVVADAPEAAEPDGNAEDASPARRRRR